jgi:Cd2+/Zn2+-exporting ATPase
MQVTSLLSQHDHEHGDNCGCGHDHEHSTVHLWQAVLGVVFVLNAYVVDWLFESSGTLSSASAFIGAVILGWPIVVTAIKDLRVGRLSINELVAIAVLAAFASGRLQDRRHRRLLHAHRRNHRDPHGGRRTRLHRIFD